MSKKDKSVDNISHGLEVMARVEKQRKRKPGIIIGTAVALLVGGAGTAYATIPAVRNAANLALMSPEKYCEKIYRNALDKTSESFESMEYMPQTGVKLSAGVKLDDTVIEELRTFTDSTLFSDFLIEVEANNYDDWTEANMSVTADDRSVISLNAANYNGKAYIQIPKASEKYISYDTSDIISEESYDISPDMYSEFVTTYGDIIVDTIAVSENKIEKNFKGSVSDVEYKYNKIITNISSENAKKLVTSIADTAQKDDKLRGMYDITPEQLENSYDEFINDLREIADEITSDTQIVTFVDPNGDIRGLDISINEEKISFITAKNDNNIAINFEMPGDMTVTVTAVENNGSYTGSADIVADGETMSLNFENLYIADKKYIVGNITIDSEELTDGKADVLAFSFEKTEDSQKITTSIEGAGEVFIEYKTYTPDDKDYTVPTDVVDFENIDAYLESVDIENFITDVFGALGINESIVDSYLSGVMYGMSNMDIIGEADEETSVMIGDFM